MTSTLIEKQYQASLDYLYSFVDYSMTRALRYSPDKFDLGRMAALMDTLGNPQKDYPILHVAGTKGKGSTAALCASAFNAAGYRVGLYTSPHLEDYSERIQVNGKSISHAALTQLINDVKPFVARIPGLTTFEITTAIGFILFSREHVDILVAEVGLGGRLDATNIITPLASVITSLSLDHMNVLGSTLTEIAGEKCGIIKPGIPVVSSTQAVEAMTVIENQAQLKGSPLTIIGRDILYETVAHDLDGQSFYLWKNEDINKTDNLKVDKHELFQIPLLGAHQMDNAATAFGALDLCNQLGMQVPLSAIKKGFKNVKWPGRFEIISRKPFVIVDSAHNLDSARRLRQTLDDYLPDKRIVLIFGASEDKDIRGILNELMPRIDRVFATRSEHPRALDPGEIVSLCRDMNQAACGFNSVEDCLKEVERVVKDDAVILATGSIFIAAAVKMIYRNGRKYSHEK